MYTLSIVIIVLLLATRGLAQSYPILEHQTFYGSDAHETAVRLLKKPSGTLLIVGNRKQDMLGTSGNVVCINPKTREVQWTNTLNGNIEIHDAALADTLLYVAGIRQTYTTTDVQRIQMDAYLARVNATTGNLLWERALGGSEADAAYAVACTPDRGCAIGGYSWSTDPPISPTNNQMESNCLFARYAAQGQPLRYHIYGGSNVEWISSIAQTATGGYLLAGITHSADWDGTAIGSPFVLCTDEWGTVLWRYTHKQIGSYTISRIIPSYDGGSWVAGSSTEPDRSSQFWLLRLDAHGELIFSKTYGDYGHEAFAGIAECTDHGLIAIGTAYYENGKPPYFKGGQDVWLLRLDASGNLDWQQSYGGPFNETGADVVEYSPGTYYALGTKENRFTPGERHGQDYWLLHITEQPCTALNARFGISEDVTHLGLGQPLHFVPDTLEKPIEIMPDRWVWDFGDGTRSTEQRPTKRYRRPGRFIVRLTVYKNETCRISWQLPTALEIKDP